ncbi:MAG: ABC transporter permease [Pseudomonadota bacterium]
MSGSATAPVKAGGFQWREALIGLILPVVILATWQLMFHLGYINPMKLPPPSAVAVKWVEYASTGELFHDAWGSLYRVVMGFAIGTSLALPLGLMMGAWPMTNRLCNLTVQVLRPIPPIAYIPMAMLWFGLGNPPALFLISIGAFFPVLMNTIAGVRQVDGIFLRAARNLGASQGTIFLRVILPAATPYIFSGMRIAMGTAFIVVIVAEMIAVPDGLGFRILEGREYFWMDKIIAGMFTIGFIGLAIDTGMSSLNNYLLRWHRGLEH